MTDLGALASLTEPLRKALYDFVAGSRDAVSRDDAARAVGVSRQVAAYHLDRLAEDGLVDIEFRRLTGRSGPGAGRPAKLYRRSLREHSVTIPPRHYELAARILLDAVRREGVDATAVAREVGEELGREGFDEALEATGYEPETVAGETRFRNCPFHALKEQDTETTCGMNLALVEGIVRGAGAKLIPVLAPEDGYCCVRLRRG